MPRSQLMGLLIVGSVLVSGSGEAAPRIDCRTPDALRGLVQVHVPELAPSAPRESGKALQFAPLAGRLDTKNFSIQWEAGVADMAMAGEAGEALEASWQALIVEQQWPLPVGTDQYLLPVYIDPSIVGTGLTIEWEVPQYPQGIPIIYLHPDSAENESFFRALAGHELHHAIQYGMRGQYSAEDEEAWYWEASAEWASELAQPELNIYAWSSQYYSLRPDLRFDSFEDFHAYGMFVLNAYLEEHVTGPGGMRAVWEISLDRPEAGWDELLEESTGLTVEVLWGGFAAAMASEGLEESSIYTPVVSERLSDGNEGRVALLGTDYFEVSAAGTLVVQTPTEGESVIAVGADAQGQELEVASGEVVGILGLTDGGADYVLELTREQVRGDDNGTGCTCGGQSSRSFALLWLLLPVGGLRRRRHAG
jgi:hypothetical protein